MSPITPWVLACTSTSTLPRASATAAMTRSSTISFSSGFISAGSIVRPATADAASLESVDADRLEAFDASLALLEARVTDAETAAERLLDRRLDPTAAAMAAVVLTYASGRSGRFERAIWAADLAETLAAEHPEALADDPTAPWSGRCLALADSGALEACEAHLDRGPPGSTSLDRAHWLAWRELIMARVFGGRGRMAAGCFHARTAALGFRDHEDRALERVAWAGVARLAAQRGVADHEAMGYADAIDPGPFRLLDCEIGWSRAWVDIADGRLSDGVAALRTAAAEATASGQSAIASAIVHDVVRVEPTAESAGALRVALEGVEGDVALARDRHARAILAGDAGSFVEAAEAFAASGAGLLAAEVFAQGAANARAQGDQRQGRLLEVRSRDALSGGEHAATPALRLLSEPVALTRRVREVAGLAARGLTSPEIAERLFLSVRTVNNHLQRTYGKLGVESRSSLAEALRLVAPE